ncbi:MAG: glycosyltransferase family 2 protein [Bacteroidia bacterium]|nr:glycosyltransferase family 2 protein [Bacteroidia bacterium]
MSFASGYIDRRTLFPPLIQEAPDINTGIITVIPSYGEENIVRLLDSLALSSKPDCETEVIVVVNAPADASTQSLENNRITLIDIESWKLQNKNCWFRLFALDIKQGAFPGWGVGLARKTGMDEAVRRFNSIARPDGIILNLDADCTVAGNYFSAIFNEFRSKGGRKACSIYFEHPLEGDEFPGIIYSYITFYELHLRYYLQALRYSGYPWVFHTVGSAMAVLAHEYVLAGGMNRRQAGEDFYLIQKLIPLGGYFSINSTTVYPSSRSSFRVPFGTGAAIEKLSGEAGKPWMTYNIEAFGELKILFSKVDLLYGLNADLLLKSYEELPEGLKYFMKCEEWIDKMTEIQNNTSGLQSFRKRFFNWFNMFMIVRYLNTVHMHLFSKLPAHEAAAGLLQKLGKKCSSSNPLDLLLIYREMERDN